MAVSLGVERSNRLVDGAVEVIRAGERLMSEVMPLQVAPETLDIVQLRSIFRQPLDGEPVGALGERGAACLAGVDRGVVEDEHEELERDAELGTIAAERGARDEGQSTSNYHAHKAAVGPATAPCRL